MSGLGFEERKEFLKEFFGYDSEEKILCHNRIDDFTRKLNELRKEPYYPHLYICQCEQRERERCEHAIEYWTDRLNGTINDKWARDGRPW